MTSRSEEVERDPTYQECEAGEAREKAKAKGDDLLEQRVPQRQKRKHEGTLVPLREKEGRVGARWNRRLKYMQQVRTQER